MAARAPSRQAALQGLHWLPTLDCLALSPDPAIKARAAAALAVLVNAGQLESQEAQIRWRDMLLHWLSSSTARQLKASSSRDAASSSSNQQGWFPGWLWGGSDEAGGDASTCPAAAADEALAKSPQPLSTTTGPT